MRYVLQTFDVFNVIVYSSQMKDGAEFVGEGFVLAVSCAVVVYEYKRSAKSAARKAEEKRERIKATQEKLQAKLIALDIRIKAVEDLVKQQQQIEENSTILNRVVPVVGAEKPKYIEPPKEKLVPIVDNNEDDVASIASSGSKQDTANGPDKIADKHQKRQKSSWWKFW